MLKFRVIEANEYVPMGQTALIVVSLQVNHACPCETPHSYYVWEDHHRLAGKH
ncbi:hypothetical protein PROFUN_16871 [Planoprotostelium fungivorum]|uniref:Uncharacterized protein n=1 Tax=Planoprotostelium fungivorum TaxID=1890364 RepID=A0A2P6MNG2_9EUKA|nr:hypothetical protein PROFUN_16871 [Planoprotostelium fungivorum]